MEVEPDGAIIEKVKSSVEEKIHEVAISPEEVQERNLILMKLQNRDVFL